VENFIKFLGLPRKKEGWKTKKDALNVGFQHFASARCVCCARHASTTGFPSLVSVGHALDENMPIFTSLGEVFLSSRMQLVQCTRHCSISSFVITTEGGNGETPRMYHYLPFSW